MKHRLKESVAAALDAINTDWFAKEIGRTDLKLQLVTRLSARSVCKRFGQGSRARQVNWDWERIYFRRVNDRNAWMIEILQRGKTGALFYGKVVVADGFASIEYLERKHGFARLKGLSSTIAFEFTATVAMLLKLAEVRIVNPAPELVSFYECRLGVTRHPSEGEVQYLSRKITP